MLLQKVQIKTKKICSSIFESNIYATLVWHAIGDIMLSADIYRHLQVNNFQHPGTKNWN